MAVTAIKTWAAQGAAVLALFGCASAGSGSDTSSYTLGGAAIGALAGGAIGAAMGHGDVVAGALVGSAAGAAAGTVADCHRDGGCGGEAGPPNHRQYFDETTSRYYYYDPATRRYFWEDGTGR